MLPNRGSNPQPRYVSWLGMEPVTFWSTGRCSSQLNHTSQGQFSSFWPLVYQSGYSFGVPPCGKSFLLSIFFSSCWHAQVSRALVDSKCRVWTQILSDRFFEEWSFLWDFLQLSWGSIWWCAQADRCILQVLCSRSSNVLPVCGQESLSPKHGFCPLLLNSGCWI